MSIKKTARTKSSAKGKTSVKAKTAKGTAGKIKKKPVVAAKKTAKPSKTRTARKPATVKKAAVSAKKPTRPVAKTTKTKKPVKVKSTISVKTKTAKPVKKTAPVKRVKKAAPVRAKIAPAKKIAEPKAKPIARPTVSKPPVLKLVKTTPPSAPKKKPESVEPMIEYVATSHLSTMGVPPYQEKAGEEYMNIQQRNHFRQILNLWKQELMEEVDRTVHHMQDEAANFPDPNDRASQEEEFSLELRARDRERKLVKKIYEALNRMDHDDYGYCDTCGIEIGIRRLEARPTATLCIDCKTLAEIKERQLGGVSVE